MKSLQIMQASRIVFPFVNQYRVSKNISDYYQVSLLLWNVIKGWKEIKKSRVQKTSVKAFRTMPPISFSVFIVINKIVFFQFRKIFQNQKWHLIRIIPIFLLVTIQRPILVWPNFCRTLSHILQGLPLG